MTDRGVVLALAVIVTAPAAGPSVAQRRGLEVEPDPNGQYEYVDDFTTARFLDDASTGNLKIDCWQKGSLSNTGPNRNRTLTYRFFGDRLITDVRVRIDQAANGPNLGGTNRLLVSSNGLDWTEAATSGSQKASPSGWQREPLAIAAEQARGLVGRTEVWLRVVMDNTSGLKTNVSNRINSIHVQLGLGEPAGPGADPQAAARAAWGRLRRTLGWRCLTLDRTDPVEQRAPHYYEDADGWLCELGAVVAMRLDEREGFPIRRDYLGDRRPALSLTAFVKTDGVTGPIMARIIVRSTRESSRTMNVLWDGKPVATFDAANYFETERPFFVEIPGAHGDGVHELRIAPGDAGAILIRQVALIGAGALGWAEKPSTPKGGSLEVLSAYYMPDPAPPPDSQAVEGRTARQAVGLVFRGMQRLYKEHAEFGAIRILVRNAAAEPVRIGNTLLLNAKPIEDGYVDFAKSAWDASGVVWYLVRPGLLAPGQCGEAYVRFRRRPPGLSAAVTIPIENGKPLTVAIPYRDLGATIDYVTTNKTMDLLYVYVRKSAGANPGRLTGLSLDGKALASAKIYGADFPGNVALGVAKLPTPLAVHGYHVVSAQTEAMKGTSVAAQFRVLPFVFPRGSIHTPVDQLKAMHMNTAMWRMVDQASCEKYGVTTTCQEHGIFDVHPRVSYIFGPDEPDAHDNRGGGYDKGLGWHARRLADAGWQTLVERFAPHVATWLIMDGTVRPMNWFVYGQVADVTCFDPYPITYYGADHAHVRESLSLARLCGAPRRMYACLEAYGWQKGQGVPKKARGPIPAEYRQNVVQAIGAGMKGLTSWVYSSGAGGWQLNKPVADEIAKLNALIAHIEDDLLLGTPIDLATSDAGNVPTGTVGKELWPKPRVWVGALLCGPDTIVLAVANHIPAGKPNAPKIEPARNVTITVSLPEYIRQVSALEATEDGVAPHPCTIAENKAVVRLDSIESGRVFVLRRPQP